MMAHLGQPDVAETVHNAWLTAIEDGIHTYDIFEEGQSSKKVGTQGFADAVIARLGRKPRTLKPAVYDDKPIVLATGLRAAPPREEKKLVGVDVFIDQPGALAADIAKKMNGLITAAFDGLLKLDMITNRGVKVWPNGLPETFCTDHWRVRYMAAEGKSLNNATIAELLRRLALAGTDFVKMESLYTFDGKPSYSLGQGQ